MVATVNYVAHADLTGFAAGPLTHCNASFTYGQAAWQLFAEYNGPGSSASLIKSYVYGNYIDKVLQMRDHASGEDYFYHQDDLFSVYAMTDEAGAVVERYEYGDYGQVSIMAGDGTSRAASLYGNRHTFTGRLLDDEMTLAGGEQTLQYRHRYMFPTMGRFVHRDPLNYVDGINVLAYVRSMPLYRKDPFGLGPWQVRPPNFPVYPGDDPAIPQPKGDFSWCVRRCMEPYWGDKGIMACLAATGLDILWGPVQKTPHEMRMPHTTDMTTRARRLAIKCGLPRQARRLVKTIGRAGAGIIGRIIAYPSCGYVIGLFVGCTNVCAHNPESY